MRLKIVSNRQIACGTFRLDLENPGLFNVAPGQFFMLRINEHICPTLRRPLSIADFKDKSIGFIYKVVGEGTRMLTEKRAGEFIDVLGPLGRGFDLSDATLGRVVLVGGGIGVAPLLYLKEILHNYNNVEYSFLAGYNTSCEIFADFGNVATMDGSRGFKGSVVDYAKQCIDENTLVFACGPYGMLGALAKLCNERGCRMQVSLEERMGCGVGACLGCVVMCSDGNYRRVCKEGPVFDYRRIKWQ